MAIVTEQISETLVKTYSDAGYKIHGGSPDADYDAAIDPISAGRTYIETDIPVEDGEEATVEDYQEALKTLGVM